MFQIVNACDYYTILVTDAFDARKYSCLKWEKVYPTV